MAGFSQNKTAGIVLETIFAIEPCAAPYFSPLLALHIDGQEVLQFMACTAALRRPAESTQSYRLVVYLKSRSANRLLRPAFPASKNAA